MRDVGTYEHTVENSIDSGPLLEEHSETSNDDSSEHGHRFEQAGDGHELKLDGVYSSLFGQVWELLCGGTLLEDALGLDLGVFDFNELVVLREATKIGKHTTALGFAVVVDKPTWREGHEDHTNAEKYGWSELEAKGKEP